MLLTLERIQESDAYIRKSRQLGKDEIEVDTLEEDSREQLDEKVAYLRNACQNTLLRTEFETKRVQSLIQVVSCILLPLNHNTEIALQ